MSSQKSVKTSTFLASRLFNIFIPMGGATLLLSLLDILNFPYVDLGNLCRATSSRSLFNSCNFDVFYNQDTSIFSLIFYIVGAILLELVRIKLDTPGKIRKLGGKEI